MVCPKCGALDGFRRDDHRRKSATTPWGTLRFHVCSVCRHRFQSIQMPVTQLLAEILLDPLSELGSLTLPSSGSEPTPSATAGASPMAAWT